MKSFVSVIRQFVKDRGIDLAIMLLVSLIPLLWLPQGYILTGHDSGYPINVLEAYKNRLFTWNSQDSFGLDNTTSISVVPVLTLQALARFVGLPVAQSELVTFVAWFFLMQIAMYALSYSLRDRIAFRWFPLFSAVSYVMNFYLLALWRYAAGTTFSAYTALPLCLMVCLSFVFGRRSSVRTAFWLAVILTVFNGGGGLSIPLFGGLIVSIGILFLYALFLEPHKTRFVLFKQIVVLFGVTAFLWFILNAYWVLPFGYYVITSYLSTLAAVGGKAAVVKWTDSVSSHTSIANLFRLQGYPDWYNNPFHPYANVYLTQPILILLSMLIAPVSYLAVYLAQRGPTRRVLLYFAVVSLVGIFFAAGTHPPTGPLYSFLMLYVPGFVIFRSAQYKFIPAVFLAFSFLGSYAVNALLNQYISVLGVSKQVKQRGIAVLIFILLCGVGLYHYPYFQRTFFYYSKSLSTLIRVPSYVTEFDSWIKTAFDDEGRTLILPRFNSTWKAGLFTWKYFSLYSPFNLITPKPFVQYSYYLNEAQFTLFNRLAKEFPFHTRLSTDILSLFQVRHILLAEDIDFRNDEMPSESPSQYKDALSLWFSKQWQSGPWSVYSVPSYQKQKIYAADSLVGIYGNGQDAAAPLLAGATTFMYPSVFGRSTQNPPFSSLPVSGTISAMKCVSCAFNRSLSEIIPSYVKIVPGSRLYPLKRWRENQKKRTVGNSVTEQTIYTLGTSLLRLSELIRLVETNGKKNAIESTLNELDVSWTTIENNVPKDLTTPESVDLFLRISEYATSEHRYVNDLSAYLPQQRRDHLLKTLSTIMRSYAAAKQQANSRITYQATGTYTSASFFVDAATLPRDENGYRIPPLRIIIQQKEYPLQLGRWEDQKPRVDIGTYAVSDKDVITLVFSEIPSLLTFVEQKNVSISGSSARCDIYAIRPFHWETSYVLHLPSDIAATQSFQLYVRSGKQDGARVSPLDTVIADAKTVNFSRTEVSDQDIKFSWADNDSDALVYACVSPKSERVRKGDLSLAELVQPSLYASDSEIRSGERLPVTYRRIDQTKYTVDLSGSSFPLLLVFNENYNPLWRLSSVSGNSSYPHMQINGYANAWYIKTKPQSDLVIEFYPQKLFRVGVGLSILGMFVCGGIIWYKRKQV